jgi:hypothetical protein
MPRPDPLAAATAAALLLLASCGGDRDLRKTYPVTGTVTVDGKPAPAGVLVSLHPQFTETDRLPIHPKGATDDAGRFKITTYNTDDGAPEGEYVVTVEWLQRLGPMSSHFGNDLFAGAFAKPEENKGKPEFTVTVTREGGAIDLKLTLPPEAKKKIAAKK